MKVGVHAWAAGHDLVTPGEKHTAGIALLRDLRAEDI